MSKRETRRKPKYVARGTYGCVLAPPVPCADGKLAAHTTNENVVSKVFHSRHSMEDEAVSYKRLVKEIDPKGFFTVKLFGQCSVNIGSIPSKEVAACKYNTTEEDDADRYIKIGLDPDLTQLLYDNGGKALNTVRGKGMFKKILFAMRPLFRGIVSMARTGMVHQDIKPPNVVYNKKTDRMFLIDFGLSANHDDIYKTDHINILQYRYPYFPPEYRWASAIIKGRPQDKSVLIKNFEYFHDIYIVKAHGYVAEQCNVLIHNYYKAALVAFDQLVAADADLAWLNTYSSPKIDVYMLGLLLLHELIVVEKQVERRVVDSVCALCWNMVNPIISTRFTARQALNAYDNIIAALYGEDNEERTPSPKLADVFDQYSKEDLIKSLPKTTLVESAKKLGLPYSNKTKAQLAATILSKYDPARHVIVELVRTSCPEGMVRNIATGRCRKT